MTPNGKNVVVRSVFLVACAVASLAAVGSAETARGTFKLPMTVRWGNVLLAPGEYEFTADTESNGKIVTVRSKDSGWSGMIMSCEISSGTAEHSSLELRRFEGEVYVHELYLSDLGLALDFSMPGGKSMVLTKPNPKARISAAGLQ